MKDEPFSLILLKNIMKNYYFNIDLDGIKFFYCFMHNNSIMFNFLSYKQIKLYEFNSDKYEFNLVKVKDYSNDRFNKYFYYMKKSELFIIFNYNEVVIYDNMISTPMTLFKIEEDEEKNADTIYSCKELLKNIVCIIFNHSISFYNLELEEDKLLGSLEEIKAKSVKLIETKEKNLIVILLMDGIYIFDFKDFNFINKLNLDMIKNIKKIKVLPNSDIAIIYGENNLAIYDINLNIAKYTIKNESNMNKLYKSFYFLKKLDEFTLLYNPSKYSFHAIDYYKGEALAKFSDSHNRIIRCRRIHFINIDENSINDNDKVKYYFLVNVKGYFIFTIKK